MTWHNVRLISCVGVDFDLPLLPHFLEHYRNIGVAGERMHLVLNAADADTPALADARKLLSERGVEPTEIWIGAYTSDAMWAKRREVQQRVAAADDWVLSADVDELHEYPEPLPTLLRYCERRGVDCVQGPLIDRLAADLRLAPVQPAPSLFDQFPVEADVAGVVRRRASDTLAGMVKVLACRGAVLPSRGGHHPAGGLDAKRFLLGRPIASLPLARHSWLRFGLPCRVHHFKWTTALLDATRRRLATPGVSSAGREYGELLLDFFAEGERSALEDVPVRRGRGFDRVPWRWRVAALRVLGAAGRARRVFRQRAA